MSNTKNFPLDSNSPDPSKPESHRSLVKSSGLVAIGVLSSRLLGFIRDMVLANVLGTGWIADAFLVAQRIPNLLRDLVGEGAANAAIVPVISEYHHHNRAQWLQLINVVMAWGVIILGGITLIGIIAAPLIVRVMAPGFVSDPAKFELTVNLTRIMFPYLILIALTAVQVGILYSLRSFFTPAFGPCLLNIAMILCAWLAASFNWALAYALAGGVLIGGVWQFLAQYMALKKLGVKWELATTLNHEGAKKIGRLMVPRIWGSAVYQLNVFADTFCASLSMIVGSGGIAAIYFANRIVQFPLGIFGYALSSVTLPSLSAMVAKGEHEAFRTTLSFALRNLLYVLIPAAVLIALVAKPLIQLIFQHGAFDDYSTQITVTALVFYVIGLPFFGITRILVAAFYAKQDTKTPVRIATMCLILNVAGNVILMFPLKIGGIALASSLSSVFNCWLLIAALESAGHQLKKELLGFVYSIIVPIIAMVASVLVIEYWASCAMFLKVFLYIVVAGSMYILTSLIMNVKEAKYILGLIQQKFNK